MVQNDIIVQHTDVAAIVCFRCHLEPGKRVLPEVHPVHCDPEAGALVLDPSSWNCKWGETQQGGDVCQYKMSMAGPVGPVKLCIR